MLYQTIAVIGEAELALDVSQSIKIDAILLNSFLTDLFS